MGSKLLANDIPMRPKKVLVIDVGGTHLKLLPTGRRHRLEIPSGPKMTAKKMVEAVRAATVGWKYDAVSIGYPGPVVHGRPVSEPHNLPARRGPALPALLRRRQDFHYRCHQAYLEVEHP